MNFQDIYDSIDLQHNLYKSGQGADYDTCKNLADTLGELIQEKKTPGVPDFIDYYMKLHSILSHQESGTLVKNGVKYTYARNGNKVIVCATK